MRTEQLVTAEQLEVISTQCRCELVDGELHVMTPPGGEHGWIAGNVHGLLWNHVRRRKLGMVFVDAGYLLSEGPDTVLGPDVSFIQTKRLPTPAERISFMRLAPDLAVEVVSPSDRGPAVEEKVRRWLDAGAEMVWVVWSRTRTISVYRRGCPVLRLKIGDKLEGGDVAPGFVCEVREVFE